MPAIPVIRQQTMASSAGLGPGPGGGQGIGALGEGLADMGRVDAQIKVREIELQERNAAAEANAEVMDARTHWLEKSQAMQQNATPGAEGFTPQVMADFDADAAERVKKGRTQASRDYLKQRLADVRLGLFQDSLQFEAVAGAKHRETLLGQGLDKAKVAVEFKPEDFDKLLDEQNVGINASGAAPQRADEMRAAAKASLAEAAVLGMIRRNPAATLKQLNDEKSKISSINALEFPDRERLRNAAESEVRRLESEARVRADRAEAKADRVLAAIDRQISTGVPATTEMWKQWEQQVKGMPQEKEFRDRFKIEQRVQQVLKLPVDQQAAYVQQQESELLKGGGTVQQAANLQRLREAVKRNITLLQEAPLLFNDNRTGGETQPIDFGAIETEEGSAAMRANLHDRVLTLDAMRKQYGGQVQTRPLLPQEAQMLTSALESSSPKQTAQVFAQLRDAVGDDEMFLGIMHQIAPDSPVKAEAGVLAAKQRSLTLERNWIADNVVASSRDVAATILEGEAILNKSKAAGKSDGKPDKGLFMPSDQDLQRRFSSEVGAAFAGRPAAADIAFQLVKSYYAGKSAQTGRIAASPQDVDGNIVKEAIKASLGTVVDYNARGEVLAPWGMSEDEFDDSVHKALQVAAGQAADPTAFRDRTSLLGLAQRTESTYYLRTERGFVTDSNGQPLVIDVMNPTKALRSGAVKR